MGAKEKEVPNSADIEVAAAAAAPAPVEDKKEEDISAAEVEAPKEEETPPPEEEDVIMECDKEEVEVEGTAEPEIMNNDNVKISL